MTTFLIAIALGSLAVQQHDHAAMTAAGGATTTLSEQQVAELLAGEGMGLAKPAEMNHYPGPRHVLDLADALKLTTEQRRHVQDAFDSMRAAARALGARIVETERALDMSFRTGHIDQARLLELTSTAGRLQGELRAVHLGAHLTVRGLLTDAQIREYDVRRGYAK